MRLRRDGGELGGAFARPDLLAAAEKELAGQGGRVLLRYSGTEPKARLLLEGRDGACLEKWSQQIAEAVKRQVGARSLLRLNDSDVHRLTTIDEG
jgi:hypothetical protein